RILTGPDATLVSFTSGLMWTPSNFFSGSGSFVARIAVAGTPVTAPSVSTVNPNAVMAGSWNTTVTVNGTNFFTNATVKLGGQAVSTTWISPTQLTAYVTADLLAVARTTELTVTQSQPDGGATSNPIPFTVRQPAPKIDTLSPDVVTAGTGATTIQVDGANFLSGATVKFGTTNLVTTYVSPVRLSATIPATALATAGTRAVTVANPGNAGGPSNSITFTINNPEPAVTGISPETVPVGSEAATLTVNGSGFVSGSTVSLNGTALPTTFVSGTTLTAAVPATSLTTAGTFDLTVSNPAPGGGASEPVVLTVANPLPTATALAPSSAKAGASGFTLTVNGSAFVRGAEVRFGATALTTTFVSATQLTATVPSSALTTAGTIRVTVNNPEPGGGVSGPLDFTINNPTPTVTALSPTQVTELAGATTLTVTGTGFVRGSVIRFKNSNLTTTYLSATQVRASVPSSLLTTVGDVQVTVTNPAPGGGVSNAAVFKVAMGNTTLGIVTTPAPTITRSGSTLTVKVTIRNNGNYSARGVTFTGAKLNTTAQTTLSPTTAQTIAKGGTLVVTLTFPTSAAAAGTKPKVTLTYASQNAGNASPSATCAAVP
ncbi:MAG: hypothetical protein SFU56_02360, partial [Capsulimonadales bacterium]|nr:hypothetical protein [Capsulimonadales bacterium]